MNKTSIYIMMLLAGYFLSSCKLFQKTADTEKEEFVLENIKDSVSYALGASIAGNLKSQGIDSLNTDAFVKGVQHAIGEDSLFIASDEANSFLREYFNTMQERKEKAALEEERKFMEKNAEREEVTVTESGLQYEVLEEGDGKQPEKTDRVKVHYHGTLLDGEVFDSSVERGPPSEFALNRVIKGWTEGLQLMKEGAKYKFYIPSELGYGKRGSGNIGPNETLIFEVELIEVK